MRAKEREKGFHSDKIIACAHKVKIESVVYACVFVVVYFRSFSQVK